MVCAFLIDLVQLQDLPKPMSRRPRGKYSRLICLGCRNRRIRCELPRDVEVPDLGELRTVQTPCYRCKRLGLPCVVRQTSLGRSAKSNIIDLAASDLPDSDHTIVSETRDLLWKVNVPLLHKPQCPETTFILHAFDTLRCERVEEEWFRHLPIYVGHTRALDLSIQAIVTACAYSRGVPKLTTTDCYHALAVALEAVQVHIHNKQSSQLEQPNDDSILASTALLLPFEGVIQKNGIPTNLHLNGLAAILAARESSCPVSQLAIDIFDFHASETSMLACLQGVPSPFENISRAYFANTRIGCGDSDRTRLKSIGNELFVRIPRLVNLLRTSRQRGQPLPKAFTLLNELLPLRDSEAEERLFHATQLHPAKDSDTLSCLLQSLHFANVKDFEALLSYWQTRLSLFRLEWHLHELSSTTRDLPHTQWTDHPQPLYRPTVKLRTAEISRLVKNILMSLEYAATVPLRRHDRLMLYAVVGVWGVIQDLNLYLRQIYRHDEEASRLSDLLLCRINVTLAAKPELTKKDVDTVADIFAGGDLEGRFAKLHGF